MYTLKMKTILFLFMGIFFLTNCKSTNTNSVGDTGETIRSVDAPVGLVTIVDLIQRVPGITVRGTTVRVFGPNSFSNVSEPLFLVNGVAYSGGFEGIRSSVNPTDVKSVEVYKTPSELAIYGARGSNGVINIILK
jgi:outer membrane receptor protein involved in Fe transport